jgi:hypothetical protein
MYVFNTMMHLRNTMMTTEPYWTTWLLKQEDHPHTPTRKWHPQTIKVINKSPPSTTCCCFFIVVVVIIIIIIIIINTTSVVFYYQYN